MSGQRYTEQFKIEAVKQVTDRGRPVIEVAERLGVTSHSLYQWVKKLSIPEAELNAASTKDDELRRVLLPTKPSQSFQRHRWCWHFKCGNNIMDIDVSSILSFCYMAFLGTLPFEYIKI
jgi:hypothetical protein